MKIMRYLLITAFAFLAGCMKIPLSPQEKSSLHRISVSSKVDMPKSVSFRSRGSQMALALGGAIGYYIQANTIEQNIKKILLAEQEDHVSFDKILVDQFDKQIAESKTFQLDNKNQDAVMKLSVGAYGLAPTGMGFSNTFVPEVGVQAQLVRHGKVIWQDATTIYDLNYKGTGYTMKEIEKKPEILKNMWMVAAEQAAEDLINKLNSQK